MGLIYLPISCEFNGQNVVRTDIAADPDTSATDLNHTGPERERRFNRGNPQNRTDDFKLRGQARASEAQAIADWRALQAAPTNQSGKGI